MYLSYIRLRKFIPLLNVRPLTEADFYAMTDRLGIKVHMMPLEVNGYYLPYRKQVKRGPLKGKVEMEPHIHINQALTGYYWLETAYHELVHYLLHLPLYAGDAQFSRLLSKTRCRILSKQEHEARSLALIALIPSCLLTDWDLLSEYADEMIERRVRVWKDYRI